MAELASPLIDAELGNFHHWQPLSDHLKLHSDLHQLDGCDLKIFKTLLRLSIKSSILAALLTNLFRNIDK